MNWIPKVALRLARTFSWQGPSCFGEYVDRDAQRAAHDLEMIKLRFPHHS